MTQKEFEAMVMGVVDKLGRFREWMAGKPAAFWAMTVLAVVGAATIIWWVL